MYKTFLFTFAVVFCVDVYVISAEEVSANDVATAQPEISDFLSVDTAEMRDLYFNGSELAARADDCKCENGKCMRKCDIEKTVPCVDETKVCVCDPEFAETDRGVCKYCDCGPGFSCIFTWYRYYWKKNCICPKGFHEETYSEQCIVDCSDKQPCRNGGICYYNKECDCPSGTSGVLCEKVRDCSDCVNRLEVDCLYDQSKSTSYCRCKNSSLFYDYGRDICIPCPCGNGRCFYDNIYYSWKLKCECYSRHREFNGHCKECDCGLGGRCNLDNEGKKYCVCSEGYYEREGYCRDCECTRDSSNKCEVNGNKKRCFCKEGYQDVLGHCEDINECETNNTCHPSVTCYNTFGGFECRCPEGYKGPQGSRVEPGEECEDINECEEKFDVCHYQRIAKCVNIRGSYKCECRPGYEPNNYVVEPYQTLCIESRKNWVPALIVIFTSGILICVSYCMHVHVRKRAARSN